MKRTPHTLSKLLKALTLVVIFLFSFSACGETATGSAETVCRSCNEEISSESLFCSHCGATVNTIEDSAQMFDVEPMVDAVDEIKIEEKESGFPNFDLWIDVENTRTERYMYEMLIEGFLIVDDEIDHGWLDDGTKAFLRAIKGDSISSDASVDEYFDAYNSLDEYIGNSDYCIRDFFTVDSYDNSTNSGIYNFLETLDQLEGEMFAGKDLVTINNGSIVGWDFDDAEVATKLGISEELITILMHAAVDAGFVVTFD